MRIALGIEYAGCHYNGWQSQKDGIGIQSVVEKALSFVADHHVQVACAGRTDTGVHALEQVVHFDTSARRDMRAWVLGTNANLPDDVSILWAVEVNDDFHARFSATARSYRYIILNRDVRPAIFADKVSWDHRPLDVRRMQQAAKHLVGEHDFTSYRTVHCQSKTPMRKVTSLELQRQGNYIFMDIQANAFLHHMVRNIAGVLMSIGAGENEPLWSKEVLEMRDRTKGGITAPGAGLYFMSVTYPDEYKLPQTGVTIDLINLPG